MYIHNFMVHMDHPTRYTKCIHTPTEVHCSTKIIPNTSPISITWIYFLHCSTMSKTVAWYFIYTENPDIFLTSLAWVKIFNLQVKWIIYIYMSKWVYNFKLEIISPPMSKNSFSLFLSNHIIGENNNSGYFWQLSFFQNSISDKQV